MLQSNKRRLGWLLVAVLAGAAPPLVAQAGLSVAPVIVDFQPGDPPRADLELFNDGEETLYVVIEPAMIEDPGDAAEKRVQNPDPQALGLLATPNRLVLEPGQRKFVRIATLSPPGETDRIYRVTVKPVVGGVKSSETGLKILIGYDLLVIQRPAKPNAPIVATRSGATLTLRNGGNTNAELFQGQQCDPQHHCTTLPGHRIYAGASWSVPIQPALPVDYAVKIGAKIVTSHF
jgi:Mat/Ecp fimbriae periplasmic chaperone